MMLSIGDLLLDIAIVPAGPLRADDDNPASISFGGGGQAANFCAWAAKLGEPARLITRVGDDSGGRLLVDDLLAYGVDVRAVWGEQPTGAIAVLVGPNGERTMATQRGASVGLQSRDLQQEWFDGVRLIHVPAYSLFEDPLAHAARVAIGWVRRAGGILSIDLSSVTGLQAYGPARMAADIKGLAPELLFATVAEAATLGVPLETLAKVPVVKLGASGCRVQGHDTPPPPVQVVDPTGAGDALAAAFCSSYLRGASLIVAARHAVEVAADAVTRIGARPS
jgi:sugar/nucleoside kinase (ribokinase family)